jgi:hypothetical protein
LSAGRKRDGRGGDAGYPPPHGPARRAACSAGTSIRHCVCHSFGSESGAGIRRTDVLPGQRPSPPRSPSALPAGLMAHRFHPRAEVRTTPQCRSSNSLYGVRPTRSRFRVPPCCLPVALIPSARLILAISELITSGIPSLHVPLPAAARRFIPTLSKAEALPHESPRQKVSGLGRNRRSQLCCVSSGRGRGRVPDQILL